MNTPSWDLFIGLFFIIGVSYGFMMQREKVVVTMISAYASIAITEVLSPIAQKFFIGDSNVGNMFIKANLSPFTIQAGIFVGIIILITVRGGLVGAKGKGLLSPIEMLIFSILNSAVIMSTILFFLPEDMRNQLVANSKFAKIVIEYHDWWLILPIATLIVTGFRKGGEFER